VTREGNKEREGEKEFVHQDVRGRERKRKSGKNLEVGGACELLLCCCSQLLFLLLAGFVGQ